MVRFAPAAGSINLVAIRNFGGIHRNSTGPDLLINLAADDHGPNWGCGLVGNLPGMSETGETSAETQRLVDGLKASSTFNKIAFWNWNLAPQATDTMHLSADFIFMPQRWGATRAPPDEVRQAGEAVLSGNDSRAATAEMATIFLGMNEPDMTGSCMGNMFGMCVAPCTRAETDSGDCPVAHLDVTLPSATPNAQGHCNCWDNSHASAAGFWPLEGCSGNQPLPDLWSDPACVNAVMNEWSATAMTAVAKGYKYLTTPLVAGDIDYARKFIDAACGCAGPGQCACTDASCGCPIYVGFHFYAYDCRPKESGGYAQFEKKLNDVARIMEDYPFVRGAIVNEVGMLNCAAPEGEGAPCVPDSGRHPARGVADHGCPASEELPNGLATFVDDIVDMVIRSRTSDGRAVVKGLSWFNENMAGGTYNLQLFDEDGKVNEVGEAYIRSCQKWGAASRSNIDTMANTTSTPTEFKQ